MNERRINRSSAEMLERKRQLMNARLDLQRERINARFDEKKKQLEGELSVRQSQIIDAALELLTESGLDELSLRDIAKRLGIQAPALYWHFKSKEILVDHMAEAILSKGFKDLRLRPDATPWQEWLAEQMQILRHSMMQYPDGGRVVAGAHLFPAVTLGQLFETVLLSLLDAGLTMQQSRRTTMTAINYTFGSVIEEQAAPEADDIEQVLHSKEAESLGQRFPGILSSVAELYESGSDPLTEYLAGLEMIIRGAESSK